MIKAPVEVRLSFLDSVTFIILLRLSSIPPGIPELNRRAAAKANVLAANTEPP